MTNSWALLKGIALQVTYDYLKKEYYSIQQRQWACGGDQGGRLLGDGREGEGEGGLRPDC